MSTTKKPDATELDHASRGHAEFSPSGIKPIATCAGYHGKDGNSKPAVLGTLVHEALETLDPSFKGKEIKTVTMGWVKKKLAKLKTKYDDIDFIFEEDDIDEMNMWFRMIKKMEAKNLKKIFGVTVDETWEGVNVFEVQLDMDLGKNQNFGTCDRLTIEPKGRMGLLADYKTGVSVIDNPRDNHQAVNYAVGVFQKYPKLERLYFSFYVPQNSREPQTDFFLRGELPEMQKFIDDPITNAKHVRPMWKDGKAHPPIELLKTGEQCRFCRHHTICELPAQEALDMFEDLGTVDPDITTKEIEAVKAFSDADALINPREHPDQVEALWLLAKRVIAWGEDFKSKVNDLGKAGIEFPTIELKTRAGIASIEDVRGLKKLAIKKFGADKSAVNDICSPAFAKLAKLTDDDKNFREEAYLKGFAKRGKPSYFMQAPRVPKKKNINPAT